MAALATAATATASATTSAAASAVTAADTAESDAVFASAAELFRLLATPMRLKIISALCGHEKNVTQLLTEIDSTQPNMSQHLAALYRAGVLAKRREATQIYYRIASESAAALCRAVCMQIAVELDGGHEISPNERLMPHAPRSPHVPQASPAPRTPAAKG
jgi:ArsR family transcriptional regulator